MSREPLRVVVALCRHQGKLLMGRRLEGDGFFGGHWEFPGGKSEVNESDEDALRRELKEELSADLDRLFFYEEIIWQYPNRTVELQFYWVDLVQPEIDRMTMTAHSELRWVSPSEALNLEVLPANVDLLKRLRDARLP